MSYPLPRIWKISQLAESVEAEYSAPGDVEISSIASLGETEPMCLSFYSGTPDNAVKALSVVSKGAVVCISEEAKNIAKRNDINYIVHSSPRFLFFKLVDLMMSEGGSKSAIISPHAFIHEKAAVGENVSIDAFASISENTIIGDNCKIGHGAYIGKGVELEEGVTIGDNATIGVSGQASEKDQTGKHVSLYHFGRILIGKGTKIGSNAVLVQGSLQDTIIGKHCSIGHKVSIGHNCEIGSNCFISAGSTLAGSTKLSDEVWLGPGVTILNKIKIGNNAIVGIGSVVTKNVSEGKFVVGNPSREIRQIESERYNRKSSND